MGQGKLKAFTVMETIVVMVITSLLIGLGGLVVINFSKYLTNTKQGYQKCYEWKLFDTFFLKEWSAAEYIEVLGNKVVCKSAQNNVTYVFEEGRVIRKKGVTTQSFNVELHDIRTYWKDDVIVWEALILTGNGGTIPIRRSKQKTAAQRINKGNYGWY